MRAFSESCKYDFPLTPDSVVVDVGAHEANYALTIWRRYGCHVIAFEPIRAFYLNCVNRVRDTPIQVFPFAVGGSDGEAVFGVHGDMSGAYSDGPRETVRVVKLTEMLDSFGVKSVDLLKLNCEGGEYDILEGFLDEGRAGSFKNIIVQFHRYGQEADARRDGIHKSLSKTHNLEFDEPWVWSGYSLKQ